MYTESPVSRYRVEKDRIDAWVTLSNGDTASGHFFVAKASPHTPGSERVGELLNAESDFVPFEMLHGHGTRTILYNRRHVIMVGLTHNEARQDTGYDIATERFVSVLLSNGTRIAGSVRVYRPEGHDRLSDWARHSDRFRYIETGETALLVNIAHVIEVGEASRP